MSNLPNMVLRIASSYQTASTGSHGEQIRLSVHDALQELRREPYPWNVGSGALDLVLGQAPYVRNAAGASTATKLPADWIRMMGDRLDLTIGTEIGEIVRVGDQEFERIARGWDLGGETGEPEIWRDFGDGIHVAPEPDSNDYDVTFRYVKDLALDLTNTFPTIVGDAATGAWSGTWFTTTTYTSAWFKYDQGWPVLLPLAAAKYGETYLAGQEQWVERARAWRREASQSRGAEQEMQQKKRWPGKVTPYDGPRGMHTSEEPRAW